MAYIEHKKSDGSRIPEFKSEGLLYKEAKDKANQLNEQFQKAFTKSEPIGKTTLLQQHQMHGEYPEIEDIDFSTEGITKLLENLNEHKAAGLK